MAIHDVECCEECAVHDEVVQSVRGMLPDDDDLYDLAELFKVFGDSTRIRILFVLFESEMCVCDIAQLLNMTQSAISHQLRFSSSRSLSRADGTESRCSIRWQTTMFTGLSTRALSILKNSKFLE